MRPPPPPRAWLAWLIAIAVVLCDQGAKAWVLTLADVRAGRSHDLLGPLRLTLVANRGVSFGLFQSDAGAGRLLLIAFSLAVALALGIWVRRTSRWTTAVGVGFIIGGALGNVVDRVRLGQVVDFIDAQTLGFPWVFNVADSAINIGVAILLLEGFLAPKPAPSSVIDGGGTTNGISDLSRDGR